ncbi:hypothetical protein VULLAG_LOCUS1562 [Vulpes lagopus]
MSSSPANVTGGGGSGEAGAEPPLKESKLGASPLPPALSILLAAVSVLLTARGWGSTNGLGLPGVEILQ